MAWEKPIVIQSFEAGGDLTSSQYKFVKIDSGKVVVCDGATDVPIGVLQNKPDTGENAEVMMLGVSKVQADEALSVGDLVGTSADGQADKLAAIGAGDASAYIVGRVLEAAGDAGDIVAIFIDCISPARAA